MLHWVRFSRAKPMYPYTLSWAVLVLVALACTCGPAGRLLPTPNPRLQTPVPVSGSAAERFVDKWKKTGRQGAASKQFDVTFTESELTSFVVSELERQAQAGSPAPIANPQIHLTGEQMWVTGQVTFGELQDVSVQIALDIGARNGQLSISVTKISLGVLPVPQALVEQVSQQVSEQLVAINQETSNVTLTSVVIREGEMQVTGTFNK